MLRTLKLDLLNPTDFANSSDFIFNSRQTRQLFVCLLAKKTGRILTVRSISWQKVIRKITKQLCLFFEIYRSFQPLEIYLTRRHSVAVPTINLISTSIVSRVSCKFNKFSSLFPGKLLTDSATLQFVRDSLSDFSVVQQSSRDPSHWSKICAKCHDHDNGVVTINHVRAIQSLCSVIDGGLLIVLTAVCAADFEYSQFDYKFSLRAHAGKYYF